MKRFFLFFSLLLGSGFSLPAQEESDASESSTPNAEQVQRAIDEFNRNKKNKVNEVTVVLDAPAEETDLKKPAKSDPENPSEPAEETSTTDESDAELSPSEEEPAVLQESPASTKGMAVRVESLRTGNNPAAPEDEMTVKNSFPVKALAETPGGWKLETSESAPAFTREVEVRPGTFVTVKIFPHVLSPDANGSEIFSVTEPGYDPQRGYEQTQTVGTILEKTISQLDTVSVKMDVTLSELHRLLASLPKPETPNPKKP